MPDNVAVSDTQENVTVVAYSIAHTGGTRVTKSTAGNITAIQLDDFEVPGVRADLLKIDVGSSTTCSAVQFAFSRAFDGR
jgi:hypothetical protein